ncbi:MAG: cell division protein FtsZ [Bacillota bacterium]|jgi:cell division protein FtsZ|nr:cell division protein FtsZ [Bacillota bacterium]HHU43171.1 cell division protein FtsZ [Clostridiales bacterium]
MCATKDIVSIKIMGIGGGGCNAVNRLMSANVQGVEFIAANTDMVALNGCNADIKIQLGEKCTRGLGAGSIPEVGEEATRESREQIIEAIKDANLLFLTAGMGGGTGTGGIPVIAEIARELNVLTIAVVTKPFEYEGRRKMKLAEIGLEKLNEFVDVLVVIPNERAFNYVPQSTPLYKVVQIADDVLHNSIIGITDIVVKPSLINLDFADIRTVIKNMKTAHIGIGRAKGENRVLNALKQAANSPLLESDIEGATQIIVNVTADMKINGNEVKEALSLINQVADIDANIIQGMGFDDTLEEEVIVTLIATGFNDKNKQFSVPDVLQKKPDAYNEQLNISPSEEGDVSSPFSVKEQIVQKEEEKDDVPPSRIKVDREIPPFLMKLRKMNK